MGIGLSGSYRAQSARPTVEIKNLHLVKAKDKKSQLEILQDKITNQMNALLVKTLILHHNNKELKPNTAQKIKQDIIQEMPNKKEEMHVLHNYSNFLTEKNKELKNTLGEVAPAVRQQISCYLKNLDFISFDKTIFLPVEKLKSSEELTITSTDVKVAENASIHSTSNKQMKKPLKQDDAVSTSNKQMKKPLKQDASVSMQSSLLAQANDSFSANNSLSVHGDSFVSVHGDSFVSVHREDSVSAHDSFVSVHREDSVSINKDNWSENLIEHYLK